MKNKINNGCSDNNTPKVDLKCQDDINRYFYIEANANKQEKKLSDQIFRVINFINERYNVTICELIMGWKDDQFVRDKITLKFNYHTNA